MTYHGPIYSEPPLDPPDYPSGWDDAMESAYKQMAEDIRDEAKDMKGCWDYEPAPFGAFLNWCLNPERPFFHKMLDAFLDSTMAEEQAQAITNNILKDRHSHPDPDYD